MCPGAALRPALQRQGGPHPRPGAWGRANDLSAAPSFCPTPAPSLGQPDRAGGWGWQLDAVTCQSHPPGCNLGTVKSPRLKGVQ